MRSRKLVSLIIAVAISINAVAAQAATIIATGQNNGDPSHSTGLFYYAIDTNTGNATPLASRRRV